jgi:hypothetical protein
MPRWIRIVDRNRRKEGQVIIQRTELIAQIIAGTFQAHFDRWLRNGEFGGNLLMIEAPENDEYQNRPRLCRHCGNDSDDFAEQYTRPDAPFGACFMVREFFGVDALVAECMTAPFFSACGVVLHVFGNA